MPTVNPAVFQPGRERDYEWAQVQYETTDKSLGYIAAEIGVPAPQLASMASRRGWTRATGQRFNAHLAIAEQQLAHVEQQRVRMEVIERVNVQMQSDVLARHRKDIATTRDACSALLLELTAGTPDEDIGLEAKSRVLSRLADTLKTLVLLERQAYGIQGVFEDIEKPPGPDADTAAAAAADVVLSKFASVLARNMGAVEVIDHDPRS